MAGPIWTVNSHWFWGSVNKAFTKVQVILLFQLLNERVGIMAIKRLKHLNKFRSFCPLLFWSDYSNFLDFGWMEFKPILEENLYFILTTRFNRSYSLSKRHKRKIIAKLITQRPIRYILKPQFFHSKLTFVNKMFNSAVYYLSKKQTPIKNIPEERINGQISLICQITVFPITVYHPNT